ncbi:MAG: entericidin A/B family lipoprotein [Micavibrio sp.]
MRTAFFLFMVIVASGAMTGCANTLDGMGRDIEKAGQSIQTL